LVSLSGKVYQIFRSTKQDKNTGVMVLYDPA
jgi:hypothetical protein